MYGQSASGVGLAVGTMLAELLEMLVEREVLSLDDVNALLRRSLDALASKPTVASHIEATALISEFVKCFDKSSS